MILLIDVGNTRLKWRCLEKGELFGGGQQMHHGNMTHELLGFMWGTMKPPESIWGVNVAGELITEQINQWTTLHWGMEAHFVTASKQLQNVINAYSEPERLGADRWMALVGADHTFKGACCVADCGTAVTLDCLNENHEHTGGLIFPGLAMMPQCVSNNTAQVTFKPGDNCLLGRDTSSCLASGATQAIVGTLERIADLMDEDSSPVNRIITGGDAPHLLPWLGKNWHYIPDLIFIGLTVALRDNKG